MNVLLKQFKEVSLSVLPITVIVIVLSLAIVPVESDVLIRYIIGAVCVTIGLGIFLFGSHIGIEPIGHHMGESIARTNKAYLVGLLGLALGFFITIAEPNLQVLANQVNVASGGAIPNSLILVVVSVGVGVMVATGLLRIVLGGALNKVFTVLFIAILILGLKASEAFLGISVDAAGAATGVMVTPFILAMGYGVSQLKGGKTSEEDSFGMVGLILAGPILAVMLMSVIKNLSDVHGTVETLAVADNGLLTPFMDVLPQVMTDLVLSLLPILILFLIFDTFRFKLSRKNKIAILKGLVYTFVGLTLFLTGVNGGFMDIGKILGERLANSYPWLLPIVGFILGLVVVLAEPAVYVLTEQVEEVTAGSIRRKAILVALSIGIACAISMAMLRTMIPALKLWHFLLPGFALATFLTYKVPPIFVGIAYDSGAVASGPMTVTFILAFAQGAANAIPTANVMIDGFGVVAMVVMAPVVAIQILGLVFMIKSRKEADEE